MQSSQVAISYFKHKTFIQKKFGNKSSVLIYRYSKYTCESCIQEDRKEIELLQETIGKDKIWLLPAYPDNRDGEIELLNILAKFNYVNIPVDSLLIPSTNGEFLQRYFAVINSDGDMVMIFFPRRGKTELTQLYFSAIKEIL